MSDSQHLMANKRPKTIFELHIIPLGITACSLPLFGFLCCVVLSLIYNFQASTATHCRVANYLPSISAAIGGFTPQRYIWRLCIALHCAPRFLAACFYYNALRQRVVNRCQHLYHPLVTLNTLLNLVENFCLLLLTCISSTENYSIHEASFITFLACSEFYMFFSLILFWWSQPTRASTKEQMSLRLKFWFFIANLASCGLAAYFFYRHNAYCESGVYSLFALCEYMVVVTNILFHGMGIVDFSDGKLIYVDSRTQLIDKSL